MPAGSTSDAVLRMEDLKVVFRKKRLLEHESVVYAVDGVSLEIARGEVLALVGESGSGKTTLGRAAIGLVRPTAGRVTLHLPGGEEKDVGRAKGGEWKRLRRSLQIVFQDPFSSIDPNMRVYDALRIPLEAQGVRDRSEIERRILGVLARVGMREEAINDYVFQLSGGQRQRIGIARVLLFDPVLVVGDEPVSMLDASLKGDILRIMQKESRERGTAFLLITHEMSVANVVAGRVAVMYLGKIDEIGPTGAVVGKPLHPYTQALLQASPKIDPSLRERLKEVNVAGEPPRSSAHPPGCKFHPRCPYVMDVCRREEPKLKEADPDHYVACWLY